MTSDQESKCHKIIHSYAIAATAGNVIPVPGLGIVTDMAMMTAMCTNLCAVFGGDMTEVTAKAMVTAAIRNAMLEQFIRTMAKELPKLAPGLGSVVISTISVALLETAGWTLARGLE